MKAVAVELGNTPAVAQASYVDPGVVQAYQDGLTIAPSIRRAKRHRSRSARQEMIEKATCRLIHRVEKGR